MQRPVSLIAHVQLFLSCLLYRAKTEQTFWTLLTIQYGIIVSHSSYFKCNVKLEVLGSDGIALGRSLESSKSQVWTLNIRTPSAHSYEWDLCPWWVIGTQRSGHSLLKFGCTMGHTQSSAEFLVHQM